MNDKPMLAPVLVCLLLGVVVAIVVPMSTAPVTAPTTNSAPALPSLSSNEFAAYMDAGGSNIHAHLLAATNPVERAVWEDIERRFKQVDWTNVAKTLRSTNSSNQSTNP